MSRHHPSTHTQAVVIAPAPTPLPPSPDYQKDVCGICLIEVKESEKAVECNKCKSWIHIKCNKLTVKQYRHFQNNPEEVFECKNCNKCNVCNKTVAVNHQAIECDICLKWVHIKCNKLDKKDYHAYRINSDNHFYCIKCLTETLPLLKLNNNQFDLTAQGIDFPEEININEIFLSANQLDMIKKINIAIGNGLDFDENAENDSENEIHPINCKYFTIEQLNDKKLNPIKHFSILHINIHSLQFHIEELRIALKLINIKFDYICISESKIRKNTEPHVDITIDEYQYPVGTPTEASKGGVLIYVKEGIDFKPREDLVMYKSKELESYFIEAINDKGKNMIIGTIYRHPCMDQNAFIDNYMQPLNDKILKEDKKTYLAGDFNFDLLNTEHCETLNFFESMMSSHLIPSITLPTKINPKKSTVIDNIFTNQIHPDTISGNLSIAISDHLPSFLIIPRDNQNHKPKNNNLYTRKTKNFDRVNFLYDYFEIDWYKELEPDKKDVNQSMKIFLTKINELLDKYMPIRKVTRREYKRRFKPWITDRIFEKIDRKNKAFKKYMKCKDTTVREQLNTEFKVLKNEITSLTRQSKKEYYNQYFTANTKNLQKIWKGIKEIINIKSKNFTHPTCIIENNKTITNPKEIADSFNKYYTSIADDILNKRKYVGNKLHTDYLLDPLETSIAIYDCDQVEIENIISSLNPRKATGPNSIPSDILLLLKKDISYPLSIIFNLSLSTGVHPDLLKIAKTIPIYKKGSKLMTGNYRPISLLSNLNKILEKLMFSRVYKFLDNHKCFYNLQFGFRSKHSTTHALIEITENIRKALDDNEYACGIFIDLQKAFDTVNHSILIDKLYHYGIRGVGNDWFKSYLSNRSQYVSIQGFDSDTKEVRHGVPQY